MKAAIVLRLVQRSRGSWRWCRGARARYRVAVVDMDEATEAARRSGRLGGIGIRGTHYTWWETEEFDSGTRRRPAEALKTARSWAEAESARHGGAPILDGYGRPIR